MTDESDDVGPWFGGSRVAVTLPGSAATVTGRVRGSTGYGRVRVLVDGDDGRKDTEILTPRVNITEVIEQ